MASIIFKDAAGNVVNEIPLGGTGDGMTDAVKIALLDCFQNVAWTTASGQTYYNALHDALYPPANLTGITAVFRQGSAVIYDNQELSDLRSYLTVTARYDDQTTATVTDYTLSGTLAAGNSTITVSYGGKTTTFAVTVTHATAQYTITNALTNCTNSTAATTVNEETAYTATLTADSGYILGAVSVTMGGTDVTSDVYANGVISISSVTGNVVITAEAVEDVGWISGVPYTIDWGDGYYAINNSGEVITSTNGNDHVSGLLPCHGVSAIVAPDVYGGTLYYYDANGAFLQREYKRNLADPYPYPVPENAYYARVFVRQATPTATITPYRYNQLSESTVYSLNTYYVFDTTLDNGYTNYGLCYGAKTLQTSMWVRSWVHFYDSEKTETTNVVRQGTTTEIEIPDGTYYIRLLPNDNTNPWIKFTS